MSTTNAIQVSPSSLHKHNYEWKNCDRTFICSGCKEIGFGARYRCGGSCGYELHKQCYSKSSDAFYTFKFLDHLPNKFCNACGKDICGFLYHSKVKGENYHPCCVKLKDKIYINGYDLDLHDKVLRKCDWCNKKNVRGSIPGWSYISSCKKHHYHVNCVTEIKNTAFKQGLINNIASSATLKQIDPQQLLRNNGGIDGDNQVGPQLRRALLKVVPIVVGVVQLTL